MPAREHDWVRVECRTDVARLRRGMTAIVDRQNASVKGYLRAGFLVIIDETPEPPK